jgi:para-aminobenzoate synthetase/4-amino-4-deoxychorismate lyase
MQAREGPPADIAFIGAGEGRWWRFRSPLAVYRAEHISEVVPVLRAADRAAGQGLWAVGFVAFEAAGAFERALVTHGPLSGLPLAEFRIFDSPEPSRMVPTKGRGLRWPSVSPSMTRDTYLEAVRLVLEQIGAGEVYQVNLTFPLTALSAIRADQLFFSTARSARVDFASYLGTSGFDILSLSPELFFALDGNNITMRPMKGTRPRGRFESEDLALSAALAGSAKDQAENLMIVDMVRNDLAKIARTGSVVTRDLFQIERYPTVWQMTSSVSAVTKADLPELFSALFPCASVTGAPKIAACNMIRNLEPEPRGVYTGAIGFIGPGRSARFSVAIRTALFDRSSGLLRFGVGSGIVADSDPPAEWEECLVKARAIASAPSDYSLLETMRSLPTGEIPLLEVHLRRLGSSADRLGFDFDRTAVLETIKEALSALPRRLHRIRVLLERSGEASVETSLLARWPRPLRLIISTVRVDHDNPMLFHKTTLRETYDKALREAEQRGGDEAVLLNCDGLVTECSRCNLVAELEGDRVTPPLASGLLPGVMRSSLLDKGMIQERELHPSDLRRASRLWVINAVHRISSAKLLPAVEAEGESS